MRELGRVSLAPALDYLDQLLVVSVQAGLDCRWGFAVEIGKPRQTITVEPVEDPVPRERPEKVPRERPEPARRGPKRVPG